MSRSHPCLTWPAAWDPSTLLWRRFVDAALRTHKHTPHSSPARDRLPSAGLPSTSGCRQPKRHALEGSADGTRLEGDSREGTAGNRGVGLAVDKTGIALPAFWRALWNAQPGFAKQQSVDGLERPCCGPEARTPPHPARPSGPVEAHQAGAQVARVGGSEAIMFGSAETPQCAAQSTEFAERCDAVAHFC